MHADAISTAEIVLAEVMNNVVEHAYKMDPDGEIYLSLVQVDGRLQCKSIDFGHPMPDLSLPIGKENDLNCDLQDLPEGGFGWFLIRNLTDNLTYFRENESNMLTFLIK